MFGRRTLAACLVALGCAQGADLPASGDSSTTVAGLDSASPDADRAESIAVARDEWNVPEVVRRLEEGGLVATVRDSPVTAPGFELPGTMLDVSGARLAIFVYPGYDERQNDMSDLDTLAVAPHGESPEWKQRAELIQSGNLAAVLLGASPLLAERVRNVLRARHFAPPD